MSGGMVTCDEGYRFDMGEQSTPFKCYGGVGWSYPDCGTSSDPVCRPHCEVACMNGGNCTAPNKCSCTDNFTGESCEKKRQAECTEPPKPVSNAAILVG